MSDATGPLDAPERIYLQPECCATPDAGRLWCEDPDPVDCEDGRLWTKYVRADLSVPPEPVAWRAEYSCGHRRLFDDFNAVTRYEAGVCFMNDGGEFERIVALYEKGGAS